MALAGAQRAAQPPQAEISNPRTRARLYLPDAESEYYRAKRFDRSGVIANLEWNRSNVSPEAYIDLKADPGKELSWRIQYESYKP